MSSIKANGLIDDTETCVWFGDSVLVHGVGKSLAITMHNKWSFVFMFLTLQADNSRLNISVK